MFFHHTLRALQLFHLLPVLLFLSLHLLFLQLLLSLGFHLGRLPLWRFRLLLLVLPLPHSAVAHIVLPISPGCFSPLQLSGHLYFYIHPYSWLESSSHTVHYCIEFSALILLAWILNFFDLLFLWLFLLFPEEFVRFSSQLLVFVCITSCVSL